MGNNIGNALVSKIRMALQGSAPSSPASGYGFLYVKSSNKHVYFKDEDGTETDLMAFISGTLSADLNFNSHKGVNVADPTSAQDAATKTYVDSMAANIGKRSRVRAATTANVTISTALNNGDSLDGVTLATGDLVLVKNQSSAAENGVYVVGASPARSSEFDAYDEHPGSLIAVQEGSTNADTLWLCTSNVGGTINSTAINFAVFTVGGTDSDAIHMSTANEISTLTEKTTLVNDDLFIIEDSEASGAKKKVKKSNVGGVGGAGALVFLESHVASASATLDFTALDDTYNDYLMMIRGIIPASAGNNLILRFATDATPTWDAGNNYRWTRQYWNIAGATGATADGGNVSNIQIGPAIGTTTGMSFNADIRLSLLRTAGLYKSLNSRSENFIDGDGNFYGIHTAGLWKDNTHKAFGIRLLMSSGNIASGAAYLYGIADS